MTVGTRVVLSTSVVSAAVVEEIAENRENIPNENR